MNVSANTRSSWRQRPNRLAGHAGLVFVCVAYLGSTAAGQEVLPTPGKTSDLYPSPPTPERVFRLETEETLRARMARDAQNGINPLKLRYDIFFPTYPPVPPPSYPPRTWDPLRESVESAFLCYDRLYFEQLNGERYGWDLGPFHPLVSAGRFWFDVAALPYYAGTDPLRWYECDTGYALPGDRMPLLLYLPKPSLTGAAAEAAAIGLLFVTFP